jgi:N-acetylglucosaminyl-diphospho-decaprenol L-rhamnosyltransferase
LSASRPDAGTAAWAAVVVNYNAGEHLERCIASLLADASAGGPPAVTVVDNASSDGSVDGITDKYPGVTLLRAPTNIGYAAAANLGIGATGAPIVAVCNPDIQVEPGTAAAMTGRFDHEAELGALGPRIRNPDGSIYPSARRLAGTGDAIGHALLGWCWAGNPWTRRYRQLDLDPGQARDADWVSGAAIWLRRVALADVGGWDDRYFMYLEDTDLCWRLHRRGWRVAYEPGGDVVHVQAVSTRLHPYRMIVEHHRSTVRFAARRWSGARRLLLVPLAVMLVVRAGVVMVAYALGRRPGNERVGR